MSEETIQQAFEDHKKWQRQRKGGGCGIG